VPWPRGAEGPAAGDRLPEVLIIGQPVQPGPELVLPVRFKLIDHLGVPINVHAGTIDAHLTSREGVRQALAAVKHIVGVADPPTPC